MASEVSPTVTMATSEKIGIDVSALVTLFHAADYAVFGLLLVVSLGIGLYYGLCQREEMSNTEGYLLGGRKMATFPAAMSLIASFMSAITLLGTPSEVYQHGTQYLAFGFSYFIVMPAAAYIYMPVFFDLGLISVYQYLEMRFSRAVRVLGGGIFCLQMCIYMAIVVYAPSLALSQVTGINVYVSVCAIFFVCIVYTTLGGIKAVLWTDTVQVIIMYLSIIAIVIKGTVDVGGFDTVWNRAGQGHRLEFDNFNPSPGERHTWWTLMVGGYFTWITVYGVNQAQVQRYLCVPTKQKAQLAIWINLVGLFILMMVCGYAGLVIYAKYHDCDPLTSESVTTADQLFPLFVMDTMGKLHGVPGLFVAGIFSGTLSTVSSGINSLAAVTVEDFIRPFAAKQMSSESQAKLSKLLAVVFGLTAFALVFVAEQLGDILQAALSIYGMVGGPLLGLFTLGMFFPWANHIGAMVGTLAGLTVVFWIGIGFQVQKALGRIHFSSLPVSIAGCPRYNATSSVDVVEDMATTLAPSSTAATPLVAQEAEEDAWGVYYLSYMYYSLVASATVLVVGLVVSFATGARDPRRMDPRLIVPVGDRLFCYLPRKHRRYLNFHVGEDFEMAKNGVPLAEPEDVGVDNLAGPAQNGLAESKNIA